MEPELFTAFRGERYADPSIARPPAGPAVRRHLSRAARGARRAGRAQHRPRGPSGRRRGAPTRTGRRRASSEQWRSDGTLVRDVQPTAYVLRTSGTFPGGAVRQRTGVFLAVAAEPFAHGRILPHERTHAGPKEDRRRLTHATGCNLSPVFLLAPDSCRRARRGAGGDDGEGALGVLHGARVPARGLDRRGWRGAAHRRCREPGAGLRRRWAPSLRDGRAVPYRSAGAVARRCGADAQPRGVVPRPGARDPADAPARPGRARGGGGVPGCRRAVLQAGAGRAKRRC